MNEITMKTTKEIMFKAYQELLEQTNNITASKTDTSMVEKAKEKAEITKDAESIISLGILNTEVVAKYENLKRAIELVTTDLEELYGIKKEANTLEALINANKEKLIELDKFYESKQSGLNLQYKEREAEIGRLIQKLEAEYSIKIEDLKRSHRKELDELLIERKRKEADYKYELERERKLENDKWEDEKAMREKALKEREAELLEREKALEEREVELDELKAMVDEIPELIQKAKESGAEAKVKELKGQHAIELNSIKKDSEWEKRMNSQEIDTLTKSLNVSNEKIQELQNKLDESYREIKNLATETVKSSGVKIIETSSNSK